MTVELEKGNAEYINIHLDSHPEELAFDFCKNHNLDISSYSYLANEIKKLLLNLRSQNLEKQESNQNSNKILEFPKLMMKRILKLNQEIHQNLIPII